MKPKREVVRRTSKETIVVAGGANQQGVMARRQTTEKFADQSCWQLLMTIGYWWWSCWERLLGQEDMLTQGLWNSNLWRLWVWREGNSGAEETWVKRRGKCVFQIPNKVMLWIRFPTIIEVFEWVLMHIPIPGPSIFGFTDVVRWR